MQFCELVKVTPKYTKWTVFIWQFGRYCQFEPRMNGKYKNCTCLHQTAEYLIKFKPELLSFYVHRVEATENGYMNIYLADWLRKT